MLGDLIYEEQGTITGTRELSSGESGDEIEVTLETQGQIRGVGETTKWTYTSLTRPDGTIIGEGKGVMTTDEGEVLKMSGVGGAKVVAADGSISYRGAVFFNTDSDKYSDLNGAAGVFEYEAGADEATVTKIWEWS